MLFKLLGKILKNLRWLIAVAGILLAAYILYTQYTALQNSPVGQLLPKTPSLQDSFSSLLKTINPPETPTPSPIPTSAIVHTQNGDVRFSIEIADTPEERALGLMYRESLATYSSMFFIHEYEVQYGYWMKNCEFPLDMLFIDTDYTIVDIKNNVQPCKKTDPTQNDCPVYAPQKPYRYVLEINGGIAQTSAITIGQKVSLQ